MIEGRAVAAAVVAVGVTYALHRMAVGRHDYMRPRQLSGRQVATLLHGAGWRGAELENAIRIVLGESGGNAHAINRANKNGTTDRGLWQFNDRAFPGVLDATAFDPVKATAAARAVYLRIGWRPWRGPTKLHTVKRKTGLPDTRLVQQAAALRAWIEKRA